MRCHQQTGDVRPSARLQALYITAVCRRRRRRRRPRCVRDAGNVTERKMLGSACHEYVVDGRRVAAAASLTAASAAVGGRAARVATLACV